MKKKILIAILMILIIIIITGCSNKVYVCYDGTQMDDADNCPVYPLITVNEMKAQKTVDNYGRGYASGKSLQFTRVNTYLENGDWYADTIFSDRTTDTVHETKLKIDGRTSSITCISGCEVLGLEDNEAINATGTQ